MTRRGQVVLVVSSPTFRKSFRKLFVSRFVVDVTLDSGVAHASIRARRCDTLHPVSARALHTVEFHVGRLAEARTAAPSHQAWLRYLGWP